MFAHIDADLLVFRCGFAAERNRWYVGTEPTQPSGWDTVVEFDYKKEAQAYLDERLPNIMTRMEGHDYALWSERYLEPLENALHLVSQAVSAIVETLQVDDFSLYLSGKGNFREEVSTTRIYKGNRDPSHRPTHEDAIKSYMRKTFPCAVSAGEEADDLIGYTHYGLYREDPFSSVIVTQDKDLDMLPGLHYNFVNEETYTVSEDQAERAFWYQLCTGDSVDNIPGLPKIGKQKVAKRLDHIATADLPLEVYNWYVGTVGDKADAYINEQGRLIWIRREKDELWTLELPEGEEEVGTISHSLFD